MIFAPDCDNDGAEEIARRILARVSKHWMPLAGVRFNVSIGIAVHRGGYADFAQMYYDAAEALYHARAEGKDRIGLFAPTAEPF